MWNFEWSFLFAIFAVMLCFLVPTQQKGEERIDHFCSANKTNHCKCCKPVTLSLDEATSKNDTICVKIKNLKSEPGIRFSFYWNGRILIQHKLRTLNFPPFCVATPRIHSTDICLKFNNLTITRAKTTGCQDFEVDTVTTTTTKILRCGCFALIRRHRIQKKKKSNLLNLLKLKKVKTIKLTSKNRFHRKDFLLKNLGKHSSSMIAKWLSRGRSWNASVEKVLLDHNISPVLGDKTSLSVVDCWCHETLFVMCECCVPIFGKQEARYRGCIKLKHLPYHKDLSVIFTLNGQVKMQESIPSSINQKLCSHYNMDHESEVKVGVCIKPSKQLTTDQRQGLCLDIDARKAQIRFTHRFGCIFLATENTSQAIRLYNTRVGE